jgi:hypothetical protein
MPKPRLSYVDPATIEDPATIAEFERCAQAADYWAKITPKPTAQAAE